MFNRSISETIESLGGDEVMTQHRIPSLGGLRAISITLVILSHLVKWKHLSLSVLGSYGELGVHIFFVLSGFLITNLLLREHERTSTIDLTDFISGALSAFSLLPLSSSMSS